MSRREDWKRVIERFPLEERSVRADWRADRPRSPIDDIAATLDTPGAESRFILLGTVGTGKTTELDRLARSRADAQSTQEQIEYAFDERRSQLEAGLTSDHEAVLRRVMVDPKHRLPNDPLAHEMLTLGHLLPYPDGTEWYYPHPLLLREFLR
jgi:hypothetical protein